MLTPFVLLLSIIAIATLLRVYLRERARRRQRPLIGDWPIRTVPLEQLDPVFRAGAFGPGLDTEVAFVFKGPYHVEGGTTDFEAWILAVLARSARQMFEFGTCTGKTAYLWARNSAPSARVVTLTLPPQGTDAYIDGAEDDDAEKRIALRESGFATFLYTGTEAEGKIEQLFSDSKSLNVSRWANACDLVFVDGSHAYSYVVSDSAKALELVRPGGLVLWHDYAGRGHSRGVYRALNELSGRIPLVRVDGTKFVAYRRPLGDRTAPS